MKFRRRLSRDSPRSRGWTRFRRRIVCPGAGFPALAGMDPRGSRWQRNICRIPRARGDGPSLFGGGPRSIGIPRARGDGPRLAASKPKPKPDSPRSRGWTRPWRTCNRCCKGFPALAGMDLDEWAADAELEWIPRARGDGPRSPVISRMLQADSPRSRGWTRFQFQVFSAEKGFPRSRGWTPNDAPPAATASGFPALAGMDPCDHDHGGAAPRIPRARGDGPASVAAVPSRIGGFPALAGMDPARPRRPGPDLRIPRARGDGPGSRARRTRGSTDSPRSRGWTFATREDPAAASWIPRARGDGPDRLDGETAPSRDSPRSRGWTQGELRHGP